MLRLYKPEGITINDFVENYKKTHGFKKVCFCGRLDPMARGEILLLINENCKQMDKYLKTDKTYEFEIIPGFQTQSDDFLGILQKVNKNLYDLNIIKSCLDQIKENTQYEQCFHSFSSKRINGKSMIELTKSNVEFIKPKHSIKIYNLDVLDICKYDYNEWKDIMIDNVKKINKEKNFNQNTIISQWNNQDFNKDLYSLKVRIDVSSGFYVRQFVRELSDKLNFPLLTFDIHRTNISI